MRRMVWASRATLAVLAAVACTEPDVRKPGALGLLSGSGQQAEVGTALPQLVELQVTDSSGRTVPHAVVRFEVGAAPSGFSSGTVTPTSAETDAGGGARVRWTLGTNAGPQTLRAWIESAQGAPISQAEVHATARPGVAASIVPVSDPIVAITVGDSVPVGVAATDRFGNATAVPNLAWQIADPAVAVLSTGSSAPDRAVVLAKSRGTTVLEARGAAAGTLRFDLRTYVGPGRDIAYQSNGNIYLLSADGATTTSLGPGSDPAWSPDGRQIAFTALGANSVPPFSYSGAAIYVMNANGSDRRALTDPVARPGARQPTWSPDGRKIAFASLDGLGGNPAELWVMNADGSAPTRVLRTMALCGRSCPGVSYPTWSPDGTRIAYSISWGASTGVVGDVFMVNADGSGDRALASTGEVEHETAWSPGGVRVAFESSRTLPTVPVQVGPADIYSMSVDGTGRTRLTTGSSIGLWDVAPAWSPDHRIAFVRYSRSFPGPPAELWVVNGDGTEARRVASPPGGVSRPAWRPGP